MYGPEIQQGATLNSVNSRGLILLEEYIVTGLVSEYKKLTVVTGLISEYNSLPCDHSDLGVFMLQGQVH